MPENGKDYGPDPVRGVATYKGRYYLLLFDGTTKKFGRGVKLRFLDGTKDFWAKDLSQVEVLEYREPRERNGQERRSEAPRKEVSADDDW